MVRFLKTLTTEDTELHSQGTLLRNRITSQPAKIKIEVVVKVTAGSEWSVSGLISGLRGGGLGIFDFDARDAVTVHLFDSEAAATVVTGVADGWDLLQL